MIKELNKNMNGIRENIGKISKKYMIFIILLLLIIISTLVTENFLTSYNVLNILSQSSIIGILAIGQTLVILTSGMDLSQGSFVALGSVLLAIFMQFGIIPAVIGMLIVLGTLGFVNAFLINRGINPFIVTLGMMGIARSLAFLVSNANEVVIPIESFKMLAYQDIGPIPQPVLIWLVLIVIFVYFTKHVGLGRKIYAVGGNEEAARLSGIIVKRIKYFVYIMSGLLVGISVMIYTSRLGVGLPDKGAGYEIDAIAATIIGGTSLSGGIGTIGGAMAGVLIYAIIGNVLNLLGLSPYMQQIVKGVIIIVAVALNTRSKGISMGASYEK